MLAREIMSSPVRGVELDTPVREVAALMAQTGYNSLPVLDEGGRMCGIVAATDLLIRADAGTLLPRAWWSRLDLTPEESMGAFIRAYGRKARHVMSHPVASVGPDAELAGIVAEMAARQIRAVVVVEADRPVGIVSRSDLVRILADLPPAPSAPRSDVEIHAALIELLEGEDWFHLEDDMISVADGVVTLSGRLATKEERLALHLAALSIPGVRSIQDDTELDLI